MSVDAGGSDCLSLDFSVMAEGKEGSKEYGSIDPFPPTSVWVLIAARAERLILDKVLRTRETGGWGISASGTGVGREPLSSTSQDSRGSSFVHLSLPLLEWANNLRLMRPREVDVDIGVIKGGPGDMLLDFLLELDVDLREVRGRLLIGVEGTDAEERD